MTSTQAIPYERARIGDHDCCVKICEDLGRDDPRYRVEAQEDGLLAIRFNFGGREATASSRAPTLDENKMIICYLLGVRQQLHPDETFLPLGA